MTIIGKTAAELEDIWRTVRTVYRYARARFFPSTSRPVGSDATVRTYLAPLRTGVIVCSLVVFGFGSWSVLASISGAVFAQGKVSVEGQVQTIQHLDGGVVSEILVRDGDRVAKGSTLLRLDSVSLETEISIAENRLYEALARRARLEAERDGKTAPVWPGELITLDLDRRRRVELALVRKDLATRSNTATKTDRKRRRNRLSKAVSSSADLSNRKLANVESKRVFKAEVRLFHARKATRAAQIRRLQKTIGQAREQVIGLEAQRDSRRRQQGLIERELRGAKKLHKEGLSPLTRLLALERQVSEIDGAVAALTADIAATGQKIGELEVEILKVEKDWQEMVLVDLRAAHLEYREYTERRASLLDKLQRVDLRAPVSGIVNNLSANTVGGVIRAADTVLEIVPTGGSLVVEGFVTPVQIDRLHEGQTAKVRLSAFNANTTPVLTGVLVHVSADLIEDTETRTRNYLIRVRIPEAELDVLEDKRLVPGMPAEVFVETGRRSPLSYLLKPLSDQIARGTNER